MSINQPLRPQMEDDDRTARLLRMAGPRAEVPADRAARVRDAVHMHWQAANSRRTGRRRVAAAGAVFAAAAVLMLGVRLGIPRGDVAATPGDVLARVDAVDGLARRLAEAAGSNSGPVTLGPNDALRAGDWMETGVAARASLRLADGTSVRLDTATRIRMLSRTIIELSSGGLYVDTGRDSVGLQIRTRHGTAHDIGTQFEVRVTDAALRLRVRTGLVEVRSGDRSIPARSGTEVTLTPAGAETRVVSVHGPEWDWTADVGATFEIEGKPLAAFLDHLCREHGWTLRYADAALARDASSIILHGSVDGLRPQEALSVALTTSGLAHRFSDGELFIFRVRS